MSQLTSQVTYEQIRRITDWQLTEENQRSALAEVVNAIAFLEISQTWGEGKTSASDGQRFAFRSKVLQQNYSYKFSDYALEFYSFVADNYAPFYYPLNAMSVMQLMCLMDCFIMKVTFSWKSITPILMATPKLISLPLPCWAVAFHPVFAVLRCLTASPFGLIFQQCWRAAARRQSGMSCHIWKREKRGLNETV